MTNDVPRFESVVLPHLDDAYTLARYLLRDEHDAQDAVQDALLRALRHFAGYRGGDARAWLLTIVRHGCYTFSARRRDERRDVPFDEAVHGARAMDPRPADAAAVESSERAVIERALAELPPEFREVIVLREVQDLSYQEIAGVIGAPIGTVMSRLARARQRLQRALALPAREAI